MAKEGTTRRSKDDIRKKKKGMFIFAFCGLTRFDAFNFMLTIFFFS